MDGYCTVVTGAASGIGYAVASELLAKGAKVLAVDLNSERLQERFGGKSGVCCVSCDLLAPDGLKYVTDAIKSHFMGVEGFVHAAGFDALAPLGMISAETMQRLFAIHAIFPVQFLGWMGKKQNHAPGSSAVLISSLSTHEGAKGHVAYAAAKGAVEGFLMPAAAELSAKGIRLNAVVLGVVKTEMSHGWLSKLSSDQQKTIESEYPLGLGTPGRIAKVVAFLLSSESGWITGQKIICDGGHVLV